MNRLEYLDWRCKGRIECKISEAIETPSGLQPPPGSPRVVGLVNIDQMARHLRERGWVPIKSTSRNHRIIYSFVNGRDGRANIWLRTHGVDLQILSDWQDPLPPPFSQRDVSIVTGRVVRHFLSKTTFNLYEGVARFAAEFESGSGEYDRFFRQVGSADRGTPGRNGFPTKEEEEEEEKKSEAAGIPG